MRVTKLGTENYRFEVCLSQLEFLCETGEQPRPMRRHGGEIWRPGEGALAAVAWGARGLRSSRLPPSTYGAAGAHPGPEQLTVQPIRGGRGRASRPSSVGDPLGDEAVVNVARMGVPDRSFWRRSDGHAFDALDVVGSEVGVVDDEALRYLPPDAHRRPQRDVNTGRVDVGKPVNCQRRLVENHASDVRAADLRPEHGLKKWPCRESGNRANR